ncbi:TAXI family TRAP transporter solute-binding subunit [Beggiatoa leptomitoformis]|uniref:TAXI family TRAP transporter solute-binding subunit n=1 Tax=Beggiatoa leptomitoformis TaxID=288004 RepID=A0A2N9YD01_9GAMM|nr:TAXI family TRAP transporter solute-binding subunit [Beggiatoa leptomitoformis]AUI68327.1 TAXI family TRAP transporter solute-binding subunit [Beggiatoa leptomitoformis]QGX03869.1 TAXI family TRAP transporter solute-binding subunit [Beggiatoa leptomitoformis]
MNKVNKLFLIIGLFSLSLPTVWAGEPVLNLCTGGKTGIYFPVGGMIATQAKGDVTVNVLETKGSADNLKKLKDKSCDAAIVQADAYFAEEDMQLQTALKLEQTATLYDEYVHLICNRQSGVGSVGDLEDYPEKYTLLVGVKGSGSALTWRSFTLLDEDYAKVPTLPIGDGRALAQLVEGKEAQCLLYVGGLNSEIMKTFNAQGDKLQLVAVDDGDFDNKKDQLGKRIYHFAKIPSGTYDKLQSGFFSSSVTTIAVQAVVVANKEWIDANPDAYNNFATAVFDAIPHIKRLIEEKK